MNNLTVIGFYGISNSGKTTLIEKITEKLTYNGFKVATIKNSKKKISIDTIGKDTWRHSQAGSKLVVLSTPVETDFIFKYKISNENIINVINIIQDFDIILIEGVNNPNIQKIRMNKSIQKRKNTILTYDNNMDELFKVIKEKIINNKMDNK